MTWKKIITPEQLEHIHSDSWEDELESLGSDIIISQDDLNKYTIEITNILVNETFKNLQIEISPKQVFYNFMNINDIQKFNDLYIELDDSIIIIKGLSNKDLQNINSNDINIIKENFYNNEKYVIIKITNKYLLEELKQITEKYFV